MLEAGAVPPVSGGTAVGSGVGVGIAAGAPELPTATEAGRLLNAPQTIVPAELIRT